MFRIIICKYGKHGAQLSRRLMTLNESFKTSESLFIELCERCKHKHELELWFCRGEQVELVMHNGR